MYCEKWVKLMEFLSLNAITDYAEFAAGKNGRAHGLLGKPWWWATYNPPPAAPPSSPRRIRAALRGGIVDRGKCSALAISQSAAQSPAISRLSITLNLPHSPDLEITEILRNFIFVSVLKKYQWNFAPTIFFWSKTSRSFRISFTTSNFSLRNWQKRMAPAWAPKSCNASKKYDNWN